MECVIISGGNISTDFALDFLNRKTDVLLIAADRGLEFAAEWNFAGLGCGRF